MNGLEVGWSIGFITIALWIGMTALGAIVSAINLWTAYSDLRYQVGKQDQRWQRMLIARTNYANELMRVVVHTLLFIAGVLVARGQFNPDPPPASIFIRCVILLTIATLLSQSIVHRWLRRRLTR